MRFVATMSIGRYAALSPTALACRVTNASLKRATLRTVNTNRARQNSHGSWNASLNDHRHDPHATFFSSVAGALQGDDSRAVPQPRRRGRLVDDAVFRRADRGLDGESARGTRREFFSRRPHGERRRYSASHSRWRSRQSSSPSPRDG